MFDSKKRRGPAPVSLDKESFKGTHAQSPECAAYKQLLQEALDGKDPKVGQREARMMSKTFKTLIERGLSPREAFDHARAEAGIGAAGRSGSYFKV